MEINTTVVILVVVLVIVLGIFAVSQFNSSGVGKAVSSVPNYPAQVGGSGCGR